MRGKQIGMRLAAMGLALALLMGAAWQVPVMGAQEPRQVDVIFTHDTHSHLNSFQTVVDGKSAQMGGFARIKTIIDEKKEKAPETLVLDGGDFSMGTLFQTVFEEEASELRVMGMLGYDATTLGNHEFDYRSQGLANMLETAKDSGDPVPALLVCNVDWSNMDEEKQLLQDAFGDYGMKDYMMVERDGVNIAILGVFGIDALACAPTCALQFEDPIEAVKETVEEIKQQENADMIICLSHCGTSDIEGKSEDEELAQAVPELDLIISGHSHTLLEEPIVYGDTAIVSAGEYGSHVGDLTLTEKDNGRWSISSYEIVPVDMSVPADEEAQALIDSFEESIDSTYLAQFGLTADQVLCENDYTFSPLDDLYDVHTEHNLGDIISDAYVYGAQQALDGEEVDVAVVPSGTIRDTYVPGEITVTDVFNSFSLGIGPDGVPGYPLIKVYLTGEELKTVAEIDASVSNYMTTARLYCSGLNMTYNPNRIILNKVTDVYLEKDGEHQELEDDKLYCVVADLYSGQMLSTVTDMSYGLLSLVPKHADGTPVEDFEDCIIYDGDQELKAWVAIARYMQSFDTNEEGVAQMPEYYNELHDRKVADDDPSLGARFSHPNKYVAMMAGVILLLILILVILVILVVKIIKKIRKKHKISKKK